MVIKISVKELVDDAKIALGEGGRLVKLILKKDFDCPTTRHPLEKYFADEGVPYYFNGDCVEKNGDYIIDLNKINIIYPSDNLTIKLGAKILSEFL